MKYRVHTLAGCRSRALGMGFMNLCCALGIASSTCTSSAHALTGPSNYWECIIDRLPKATNDQEATSAKRQCRWDFNDFYWRRALPKDNGILGFSTKASECIEKESAKTPSRTAKRLIREACIGNFPL